MQRDCKTYVLHFEQVWSTAEFILGNCEIQRLICGNCAPDLAVAERKDLIETFISSCIDTGGSINKVLNNAPENAGDKQKQKKKVVGKSTSGKVLITTIQDQSEPTTFDFEIDLSKRKLFTEYYCNN